MIGPSIPEHLRKNKNLPTESDIESQIPIEKPINTEVKGNIGPTLPPHLKKQKEIAQKEMEFSKKKVIGPTLPPHLRKVEVINEIVPIRQDTFFGDDDSDDEVIGPLPPPSNVKVSALSSKLEEIERRANPQAEVDGKLTRGEWMTVPPESRLGTDVLRDMARSFKTKSTNPDSKDNDLWTETPEEREIRLKTGIRKRLGKHVADEEELTDQQKLKEKETLESVEEYNELHRPLTLMEIHQQNQKSKKQKGLLQEDSEDPRKRKFDYEKDMQVKGLDPKRQAEIVKGAKNLNDKFSNSRARFG